MAAVSTTEREIALMHEYRTRLIADVVTGKLDVREAAAKLQKSCDSIDCTNDKLSADATGTDETEF